MTRQAGLGPEVLRAVTHPLRLRLYEVLSSDGPANVTMLAERLGLQIGTLSYHLRVLAEYGYLEEAPELAQSRREHWWRAVPGGVRWSEQDLQRLPGGQEAVESLRGTWLRRQFGRVLAWWSSEATWDQAWRDAAYTNDIVLRLSVLELEELGRDVQDLLTRWADRARMQRARPSDAGRHGAESGPSDPSTRAEVYVFVHAFPLVAEVVTSR